MFGKATSSLFIKRLTDKAILPKKGSELAAGYDLFSSEDTIVPAKGKTLIKTDISMHVPHNTYGRIAPRSGLALKYFIDTGAGVIDEDYRGEVGVLLFNHSDNDFKVSYGDRIAQLIIEKIEATIIQEVAELENTNRGAGGFGSTGISLTNNNNKIRNDEMNYNQNGSSMKRKAPEGGFQTQADTLKGLSSNIDNDISYDWIELAVLDLVGLFQKDLITLDQKKYLGNLVLKGNKKVYEVLKEVENENNVEVIQQKLAVLLEKNTKI